MKKLTILDGGMGRELKRIGAPFSQPLWSAQALIEAPHYVAQTHQSFIDAGAEIIIVNSYACVPFHLGEDLYNQQGSALAEQAAIIAQTTSQKAKHNVLVAGSLPPVFGSYRADLFEKDSAFDILSTLFNAQDKYVDLWFSETISSIAEAEVMINVLQASTKPCYYAFTLSDEIQQSATLRSGELVIEALEKILESNVNEGNVMENNALKNNIDGIFFNCSIPEVIEQAIKDTMKVLVAKNKSINIGAFANSFTPISATHRANEAVQGSRDLSPEEYLVFAKKWHSLGANIIGGCCGIGPEHIQALVQWRNSIYPCHFKMLMWTPPCQQ